MTIEALSARGHGLATVANRRVPVPGTDEGERVEIELTADRRGRSIGRVRRVSTPSPHRIDPGCDQAARCPGCPLRHLSDERRRALGRARARAALGRIAGVADDVPDEMLPAPGRDGFRARAVAHALRDAAGRLVLGMAAHGDGPPVDLTRCPAHDGGVNALLAAAQADLRALAWPPFDPATGAGTLRYVMAQPAAGGAARLVVGVAHPVDGPTLAAALLPGRPEVALLVDVVPPHRHDVLRRPTLVRGDPTLYFEAGGDRFRATLPSWTPQSPASLDALRAAVLDALPPAPGEIVEVGCGVGTLSLPLARRAASLTGIDEVRQAVADASANAAAAGLTNARFRVGRAAHALRRLLARGHRADAVVLHAMRRPFGPPAMEAVAALRPRRVVYIAPSPAALARDLAALPHLRPTRLLFLEQMPGTAHLTTIALLAPDRRAMRAGR